MTNTHQADTLPIAIVLCWEKQKGDNLPAIFFEPEEEGQAMPPGLMDALDAWARTQDAMDWVQSQITPDPEGDEDDRVYHEGTHPRRTAHV